MFHNVSLPPDFENGATGGLGFNTTVIQMKSGREQRNIEWQDAKGEWTIGYGPQYKEDIYDLFEFFMARRGRAYGFRFKDWVDFTAVAAPLGTGDATNRVFQLKKRYSSGGYDYDRTITRPVSATVVVYLDGVEASSSSYDVDYDTGVVTFDIGSEPGAGVIVTADFEFDVPVRFDSDRIPLNYEAFQVFSAQGLNIVELRE